MHSDDGYNASDAMNSIRALSKRISKLEAKFAPEPERDHNLEDKVRYLSSKLKSAENVIAARDGAARDLRRQVDEANEATEQFKKAAEDLNKKYWSEHKRLSNENRMLVEGVNNRATEITRQQDRSLRLLKEVRQRDATIQNQRKTLADLNKAHNVAIKSAKWHENESERKSTLLGQYQRADNAAFIAPAVKEMMGGLSADELHDELKKAQEELHGVKHSLDYWRNIGREQAEQLRAAEEHATEAENKLDEVRRWAESVVFGAHSKIEYIRKIVRP